MRESPSPAAKPATLAELPALLASAPHRLLFLAGAIAVLLSMGWWTLQLAALRFGWTHWPQPPIPAGWAHAMLTQYGMLPLFMFGFLLTVFPKWLNRPSLPRSRYLPVAGSVFGGYVLAHAGLLGMPWLLRAGFVLMLGGYLIGLYTLGGVLLAASGRRDHALSCWLAILSGTLGLLAFVAFLFGAPATCALLAIKLGTFGLLLPVFFTVGHRMIPFFTGNVVGASYRVVRPAWSLPLVWVLLLLHLLLDLGGVLRALWLVDLPLALVFGWHALMWKPWQAMRPGLLAVLHLAFAWLPLAFVLYAVQGVVYAFDGHFVLGRAPLHALAIGYFGSMLVAMVTRVTQGHSGRLLQMDAVPWLCFALLQGVVLLRICAELEADMYLWLVIAGCGWLLAFAPWVLRSAWIYLTPRADGKPG